MRYAVIENGRVANIVIATPEVAAEHGWVDATGAETGYFYADGVFTPNTAEIQERITAQVRSIRDGKLADTDWVVLKQLESGPVQQAWVKYRMDLRDLPTHPNFPNLLLSDWPVKPA